VSRPQFGGGTNEKVGQKKGDRGVKGKERNSGGLEGDTSIKHHRRGQRGGSPFR